MDYISQSIKIKIILGQPVPISMKTGLYCHCLKVNHGKLYVFTGKQLLKETGHPALYGWNQRRLL